MHFMLVISVSFHQRNSLDCQSASAFFRCHRQSCFVLCGCAPEMEKEAGSPHLCGVLTHQNIRSDLRSGPGF